MLKKINQKELLFSTRRGIFSHSTYGTLITKSTFGVHTNPFRIIKKGL